MKKRKFYSFVLGAVLVFTSTFMPVKADDTLLSSREETKPEIVEENSAAIYAVSGKVKNKKYTISRKPGVYSSPMKIKLKAKKGYKVYYSFNGKFKTKKKVRSGKKKSFLLSQTKTLQVYAVKTSKKISVKKLKSKKVKKAAKQYRYIISSNSVLPVTDTTVPNDTFTNTTDISEDKDNNITNGDNISNNTDDKVNNTDTPDTPDEYLDSDKDGLYDEEEVLFETDKNNPDTDGDGLTDYEELLLGTDPLTPNEYDESKDSDSDGLTDIEEAQKYRTDPNASDTDGDGLNDYDEIYVYKTDPLKEDTDEDSLSDGFEIEHGLDPNEKSTDGITNDGDRKIEQMISEDGISLVFRDETNPAKPGIRGQASGELADHVFLATGTDTAFADNRSVIGKAVYVDGDDDYLKGLTLTFDLSAYEGDTDYLTIVTLNEDGNFEPVESSLTDNILSCKMDKSGSYCVIDIEEFLGNLGIDLGSYLKKSESSSVGSYSMDSKGSVENNSGNNIIIDPSSNSNGISTYSAGLEIEEYDAQIDSKLLNDLNKTNASLLSSTISGQADIVFAIDTTGSMSSTINNVVTNVTSFATTLSDNYNVKVNYALVDFKDLEEDGDNTTVVVKNGSSNWFSDADDFAAKVDTLTATGGGDTPECDVDALETARRLNFRDSASKFIILITDTYYKETNNYGISSMEEEINLLKEDGIITSVVTSSSYQDEYENLYETTGGIFANISSSSFSSSLLQLADLIGETTSDGTWVILKHGYRYVRLSDKTDQDGDGLSTTYELGNKEELDLTVLIKLGLAMHGVPFSVYDGKTSITVYDAISDPTQEDTDGDGINDKEDDAPWEKGYADGRIGEIKMLAVEGDGACTVAMDYLFGSANTGHSFLIYTSHVKDSFDVSNWNYYITNGSIGSVCM